MASANTVSDPLKTNDQLFTQAFSVEDKEAINKAGEQARKAFKDNKDNQPTSKHKTWIGFWLGTSVLPLIGTIIGAIIGYRTDSADKVRQENREKAYVSKAMVDTAEEMEKFGEADMANLKADQKYLEVIAEEEQRAANTSAWSGFIGWLIGAGLGTIIGAIIGKKIANQEDHEITRLAQREAEQVRKECQRKGVEEEKNKEADKTPVLLFGKKFEATREDGGPMTAEEKASIKKSVRFAEQIHDELSSVEKARG